jgi:ribosomal protein S12 methylthiotransferase accessory factor
MDINVTLEGGKKVATKIGDHLIVTDQPTKYGGDDSAPAPFDLFLASIATCAGFFVKSYCDSKGIDASGIDLVMQPQVDEKTKQVTGFVTIIRVPPSVPEKVHSALQRAAKQCTVKKTINAHPEFIVETEVRPA